MWIDCKVTVETWILLLLIQLIVLLVLRTCMPMGSKGKLERGLCLNTHRTILGAISICSYCLLPSKWSLFTWPHNLMKKVTTMSSTSVWTIRCFMFVWNTGYSISVCTRTLVPWKLYITYVRSSSYESHRDNRANSDNKVDGVELPLGCPIAGPTLSPKATCRQRSPFLSFSIYSKDWIESIWDALNRLCLPHNFSNIFTIMMFWKVFFHFCLHFKT